MWSVVVISIELASTEPRVCLIMIITTHVLLRNFIVDVIIIMMARPSPAGHPLRIGVGRSKGVVEGLSLFLYI